MITKLANQQHLPYMTTILFVNKKIETERILKTYIQHFLNIQSGSWSHKLVGDKTKAKRWVSLTHSSTHVLDHTTEEKMVHAGREASKLSALVR